MADQLTLPLGPQIPDQAVPVVLADGWPHTVVIESGCPVPNGVVGPDNILRRQQGTKDGKPACMLFATPEDTWQWSTAGTAITTNTTKTIATASTDPTKRLYLAGLQVVNSNTTATEIQILDGTTIIWDGLVTSNAVSGCVCSQTFEIPLRASPGNNLVFKTITTGCSVYASAQGYWAK